MKQATAMPDKNRKKGDGKFDSTRDVVLEQAMRQISECVPSCPACWAWPLCPEDEQNRAKPTVPR